MNRITFANTEIHCVLKRANSDKFCLEMHTLV